MGAYNVINRASMQAGQAEDISVILANLDAVAAVLNGGIDNTNINAGAAIAYSKLNLALAITNGDIALAAAIAASKLAPGANEQFLKTVGGIPVWNSIPMCLLNKNADQAVASGGALQTFQVATKDTDAMADLANNRIVAKTAGFYLVLASTAWADSGAGFFKGTQLRLNGATIGTGNYQANLNTGFSGQVTNVIALVQLALNDNLSIFANQNSGGAITVFGSTVNNFQSFLAAVRLWS